MKRKSKIIKIIFLCILALMSIPVVVSAYSYDPVTVSIPISLNVSGFEGSVKSELPSGFEFKIIPVSGTADDEEVPMPESDTTVMYSTDSFEWPIEYAVPGDYVYKVFQSDIEEEYWISDKSIYTITVRITNSQDGKLEAQTWAIKDGSDRKSDKIEFLNQKLNPVGSVDTSDKNNAVLWTVVIEVCVSISVVLYFMSGKRRRRR